MHFMARLFLAILFITTATSLESSQERERPHHLYDARVNIVPKESVKMYFDVQDMPIDDDAFHIRTGSNEWLVTNSIHRDPSGFYSYESDIIRIPGSLEYQKHWQCPYCHIFWPENVACQNPRCPSRYR